MSDVQAVSLWDLSEDCRELIQRFKQLREQGNLADSYQRREDELTALTKTAPSLAVARESLAGSEVPMDHTILERVSEPLAQIVDLLGRMENDPDVILNRDLLDTKVLGRKLTTIATHLQEVWEDWITAPIEGEETIRVLEAHEPFRETVQTFHEGREKLEQWSRQLPGSRDRVDEARQLRERLATLLQDLEGRGLDPKTLEFLRSLPNGYPLESLLQDDELMENLRKLRILASLVVRSK